VALALPPMPMASGATRAPRGSFASVVGLIWRPSVSMALGTMAFAVITTFLVLYFGERQWEGAGLAVMTFVVGYIVVRLFIAHWPDQFGGWRVGAASVAVQIVGLLFLTWAPTPMLAMVATFVTGCGLSLVFPAMGVEAVRAVPPQNRGTAVACFLAFIDVGIGLTGPLIGGLIHSEGYGAAFIASAGCCALALVLMLWRPTVRTAAAA
jgi:predicted MFS family arabinose efflux permease